MKRMVLFLMMGCVVSMSPAALVDDFQSYSPGDLQAPWDPADGPAEIAGSGTFGQKYLLTADSFALLADLGIANIDAADTETTLFFRTMTDNPDANCTFGLDDFAGDGEWDNEYYIQWDNGDLQARNNNGGQPIVAGAQAGVWYNVWFVINNAANTYDIYVNTGTADATAADLVGNDWQPRGGTSGTLYTLNSQGWEAPIAVDDIHIWSGTVLANPAKPAVTPPAAEFSGALGIYPVVNPHFTEPGYVIKTDWTQVPGWSSDTTPVDSGTEDDGGANGDGWSAFVGWDDEPVWQVTSTTIEPDKTYELRVMMQNSWSADQGTIYLFSTDSIDDPNRVILAQTTQTGLTSDWVPVSTSFSIGAGDPNVGNYIGIMIDSTDPVADGYGFVGFDEVQLVDPAEYELIHGAADPFPADGAENVIPEALTLSWTPSNDPNTTGQVLRYFVDDLLNFPNIAAYNAAGTSVALSDTEASYNIGTVDYDKYVLWRVDTIVDANALTGPTWYFTMQPTDEVPIVDAGSSYISWLGHPTLLTGTVEDSGEGDIADADVDWAITSQLPWIPSNAAMQMYNRAGDTDLTTLAGAGYDSAMFEDWIGTDARGSLATSSEPLVLTLSGVPAGTYTWTSWHHDPADQTGPFSVTVQDAAGSATTADIDVTNGGATPVTEFSTTIVSDGSDIKLLFDNTGWDNSTQFFVLNGFTLSDGVNPALAVDFGTPTTQVAAGFQAYTAQHEVASTFIPQAYSALGSTVTVLPEWGIEAAGQTPYATVSKTSVDPLNPAAVFETNMTGTYTVTLTATDTGGSLGSQTASDTLTIQVAEDACAAALANGAEYGAADFDQDCDVDLDDFAALAAEWLMDISLTAPAAQ